jgi:hypothetical protein
MAKNKIAYPILIARLIGVYASLWLLVLIYQTIINVWHTPGFQATNFCGKITLITTTAPPLILAILILLSWRQRTNSKAWPVLFGALVIFAGLYLYSILRAASNGGYHFAVFALIVIIAQIIGILKIRQLMVIQDKQNGSSLYNKSTLQRPLVSLFFVSLILGAAIDLQHYVWINDPWSAEVGIMGFSISVPIAALTLILLAIIMNPSEKLSCICLCFFSIPVSVAAMYFTYRTAMQRYYLGSETGMAIVIGVIPAMIIGLSFALLIYFTCKTSLKGEHAKAQ